jgi:hypothetical protein
LLHAFHVCITSYTLVLQDAKVRPYPCSEKKHAVGVLRCTKVGLIGWGFLPACLLCVIHVCITSYTLVLQAAKVTGVIIMA